MRPQAAMAGHHSSFLHKPFRSKLESAEYMLGNLTLIFRWDPCLQPGGQLDHARFDSVVVGAGTHFLIPP